MAQSDETNGDGKFIIQAQNLLIDSYRALPANSGSGIILLTKNFRSRYHLHINFNLADAIDCHTRLAGNYFGLHVSLGNERGVIDKGSFI